MNGDACRRAIPSQKKSRLDAVDPRHVESRIAIWQRSRRAMSTASWPSEASTKRRNAGNFAKEGQVKVAHPVVVVRDQYTRS
jgi:hypothetical protein